MLSILVFAGPRVDGCPPHRTMQTDSTSLDCSIPILLFPTFCIAVDQGSYESFRRRSFLCDEKDLDGLLSAIPPTRRIMTKSSCSSCSCPRRTLVSSSFVLQLPAITYPQLCLLRDAYEYSQPPFVSCTTESVHLTRQFSPKKRKVKAPNFKPPL